MSDFEAEPDAVFLQEQCAEIARSIGLANLPMSMKQAISQALYDHSLMGVTKQQHSQAEIRKALGDLVKLTRDFDHALRTIQGSLRPQRLIDDVEGLIEQARITAEGRHWGTA